MGPLLHILLVEDNALDAELTQAALCDDGLACEVTRVDTESDFRRGLAHPQLDLILSDFTLPTFSGQMALSIARQSRPEVPFIFVSGALGEDTAVGTLKDGAIDYVLKQRLIRLAPAVRRAVSEARERIERRRAEELVRIERKRAEEQRELLLATEMAARTEAERASKMKDEFLATLSHELRTPLNAILGWSQILLAGNLQQDDLEEGLKTIERNARAQTQIIDDLLDMSRIIGGKVRLETRKIDLVSIVQSAVETIRPSVNAKSLRLQVSIATPTAWVIADPNRLTQVMWNLLTNAVKFTPSGGSLRVTLGHRADHFEVGVTDSGEGIKPEFLPFVFDRFRQADATTTRRHGGLGLGLAIVKQLVELHGGSVSSFSEGPGKGATFTFSLPSALPAYDDLAPSINDRLANEINADRHAIKGVRVLVVDDEPDARIVVRRVLEDCDAVVTTASSADEALKQLVSFQPTVLISDIGMPGEDGHSLIQRIRALGPEKGGNIPAVALTAYAALEDKSRALRAGFQLHATKPVEPAKLIAAVATLAGRVRN